MIILGNMYNPRGYTIEEKHFPDGTLKLDLPNINVTVVTWFYEDDAELFTLMCIKEHYGHIPTLYLPYLPHARMDRVKVPSDVFTLKTFANAINAMGFEEIEMLDVHSSVGMALINNAIPLDYELSGFHESVFRKLDEIGDLDELTIFFPDEGAMKRYSDRFGMPYSFGIKKRDWETGNILGLDIMYSERVKDKDVLIIDDICSRGGTFYHSAKALKAAGAKRVFLCVTHAERTMLYGEMYKEEGLIDHIFTTDSIYPNDDSDRVTVYAL